MGWFDTVTRVGEGIGTGGISEGARASGGLFNRDNVAANQFSDYDRANTLDPLQNTLGKMFSQFNPNDIQNILNPPSNYGKLDSSAINSLLGANPSSYFQGAQGYLGQAGSMFGNAASQVGSDPYGAGQFFSSVMNPNFTDVQNNPQVQSVLNSIVNQGQRGFNIGADKIAASAANASGGLGAGSAKTNALSRLGSDISSQIADQSSQTLLGEEARRQGIQQSAAQQTLDAGNRNATTLAGIASQLGQQGIGQAGVGQNLTALMGQLGQQYNTRDLMAATFPLDQQFKLAQLLKSNQSVQQNSIWDNINQVATTGGKVADAFAA